jgi:putative transcriptional regulator
MAKIVSRARQARLNHQQKAGRPVTMQEVAEATGIARATINLIELNQTKGIDFDTLLKLCEFYGVQVGELLEYSEKDYTPDLAELDLLPA